MADQPVPSLSKARERKIDELSNHFANDDLTLDELERRIERVYKAANVAELETITADLRAAATLPADYVRANAVPSQAAVPTAREVKNSRVLSLMSQTRRVGRWTVPSELALVAIMSDTRIDFTQAVLTSNTVDVEIKSVMAQLRIIVPPGMRVVMDTTSVMSNVRNKAEDVPATELPATLRSPVLHLSGFALMSDVSVVVRRREDPELAGDED